MGVVEKPLYFARCCTNLRGATGEIQGSADCNFAIANIFYFLFGFGLFASTTMLPQMLQSLYGYRALDAGLVLGPGAFVITALAPVGAQLVQRRIIQARILLFGATTA